MSDDNHNGAPVVTDDAYSRALDEAGEWFARRHDRDGSASEQEEFESWLSASSINQRAYDELCAFWSVCDEIDEPPLPTEAELQSDDTDGGGASHHGFFQGAGTGKFFKAAAMVAAAVILLKAISFLDLPHYVRTLGADTPDIITYATGTGEIHNMTLRDGSIVKLAPESRLVVNFTREARMVKLVRGEALFTVASNPAYPFIVLARNGSIQTIGTVFDVHIRKEDVAVTVVEGIVKVAKASAGLDQESETSGLRQFRVSDIIDVDRIRAGQATAYKPDTAPIAKQYVDVSHTIAWENGRLQYIDTSLSDVIADVNRYRNRKIILSDRKIGAMRFTGTVNVTMIDAWLKSLTKSFPVNLQRSGQGNVILADSVQH